MSDLHEKVRHTIKKFDLLRAGDGVVVAVSGGSDSVALLHLLRGLQDEYALALHVAHLNHRLRPEAGADAEFVRQMAVNLGIPVTVEEVDVAARRAREAIAGRRRPAGPVRILRAGGCCGAGEPGRDGAHPG